MNDSIARMNKQIAETKNSLFADEKLENTYLGIALKKNSKLGWWMDNRKTIDKVQLKICAKGKCYITINTMGLFVQILFKL